MSVDMLFVDLFLSRELKPETSWSVCFFVSCSVLYIPWTAWFSVLDERLVDELTYCLISIIHLLLVINIILLRRTKDSSQD